MPVLQKRKLEDYVRDRFGPHARLEAYVRGVVGAFAKDERVLAWDIWNEPDNMNDNSYGKNHLKEEPAANVKQPATREQERRVVLSCGGCRDFR